MGKENRSSSPEVATAASSRPKASRTSTWSPGWITCAGWLLMPPGSVCKSRPERPLPKNLRRSGGRGCGYTRHCLIFTPDLGGDMTEVNGEVSGQAKPPYISFKTLLSLWDRLATDGFPARIDKSYLESTAGGYA